jgi:hypothetical protein
MRALLKAILPVKLIVHSMTKSAPRSRPPVRSRSLTPSSPPLGGIDDSISGTCAGRQTFWSSCETVPAADCGYEQCEEVSPFDTQYRLGIYWTSMYIISTAVSNSVKDRLYTEDLSTIENVRLTLYSHGRCKLTSE